jgi:hypothetical protein
MPLHDPSTSLAPCVISIMGMVLTTVLVAHASPTRHAVLLPIAL